MAGGLTHVVLSSLATDFEEYKATVVLVVGGTDSDAAGGMVVVIDAVVDPIDKSAVEITSSLRHVNNAYVKL